MKRLLHVLLLLTLPAMVAIGSADAADSEGLKDILATAKLAGICSAVGEMIAIQRASDFIVEDDLLGLYVVDLSARLGVSSKEFIDICKGAAITYDDLWNT